MANSATGFHHLLPLLMITILFLIPQGFTSVTGADDDNEQVQSLAKKLRPFNNSVSAVFVFGDSTVDAGNNNYVPTMSKSNFSPYGRDFLNHIPTGRFSNGRLVTDFIASYAGVKDYVPPYLDPGLTIQDLLSGVCFASASSGFDPLTPQLSGVISMQKQLDYFREYKSRLEMAIGKERTKVLISKAVFLISAGTNDFVVNYFGPVLIRRKSYTVSGYQQFLLQQVEHFLQGLLDEGAQIIGYVGLPPMGCVPAVITINSDNAIQNRQCIESLNLVARQFNQMLQLKLKAMQSSGTMLIYADIYNPLDQMIHKPRNFGFYVTNTGCCGTGLFEASLFCNPKSPVCYDASKYVFWDAIHPTEATYYNLFKSLRPVVDLVLRKQ